MHSISNTAFPLSGYSQSFHRNYFISQNSCVFVCVCICTWGFCENLIHTHTRQTKRQIFRNSLIFSIFVFFFFSINCEIQFENPPFLIAHKYTGMRMVLTWKSLTRLHRIIKTSIRYQDRTKRFKIEFLSHFIRL